MKIVLTLIITAVTFVACNNSKTNVTATADNERIIKQYFDHFNNHDWTKMANMYSEIADFKDPSLGQGVIKQTRQQIIEKYAELNKVFPDIHDNITQIYPSGEKHIIVEFTSTGTTPDSSGFELSICTIFTIENGIITKDFTYFDNFEDAQNESKADQ